MDRIESLGNTLSNLTMYDIKSMYTQVRDIFPPPAPLRYLQGLGRVVLIHVDGNII